MISLNIIKYFKIKYIKIKEILIEKCLKLLIYKFFCKITFKF